MRHTNKLNHKGSERTRFPSTRQIRDPLLRTGEACPRCTGQDLEKTREGKQQCCPILADDKVVSPRAHLRLL